MFYERGQDCDAKKHTLTKTNSNSFHFTLLPEANTDKNVCVDSARAFKT